MNWFQKLFGFIETSYENTKKNISIDTVDGEIFLRSIPNNRTFALGTFECVSLGDLQIVSTSASTKSTVSHVSTSDVFNLITDPANHQALFMVASQFNCLEFIGPYQTPEDGITRYESDRTQGPACAIAAAPATLYRNCLQTVNNQINNLDQVISVLGQNFFEVKNGYVTEGPEGIQKLNQWMNSNPHRLTELEQSLKIGIQWNTEVPFVSRHEVYEVTEVTKVKQRVSQAFCSAISCAYTQVPLHLWEPFARLVLRANYLAVLNAARVNYLRYGSNKVFLTFLGGGAFGNKKEWVKEAMLQAIESSADFGLDIKIVHFGKIEAW